MVYQVGRPAMLEGNRFLPETGTPIWKMLRSSTVFADCDPEPFTVATWMLKSFILRRSAGICAARSCTPRSTVAMIVLCGLSPLYPLLSTFLRMAEPLIIRQQARTTLGSTARWHLPGVKSLAPAYNRESIRPVRTSIQPGVLC